MKCQLMGIKEGSDGGSIIAVKLPSNWSAEYAALESTPVEVDIKKWRQSRSRDANRYIWTLIDQLAEKLERSKIEIYREAIKGIGGVSETYCVRDKAVQTLVDGWSRSGIGWFADKEPSTLLPGFTNVVLYKGSSVYDTKQMSALIDHVIQDCKSVGIETLPPHEIEAMEAAWEARQCER